MSKTYEKEVEEFMTTQDVVDYGKKPLETPLTDTEKKLAAITMATNAAIIQFVNEGILPFEHQGHFFSHLADFAVRIYSGEPLSLPNTTQTLDVNSDAGRLYARSAEDELVNGHKKFEEMQQRMAAMEKMLRIVGVSDEPSLSTEEANSDKQGSKTTFH